MQLNAEDGGRRKYICAQLGEPTPKDSEAHKAGYTSIPEVAKERIRRAGKKIKEENPTSQLDTGFRVLRLDSSNFSEVERHPSEYDQGLLDLFATNIKEDRSLTYSLGQCSVGGYLCHCLSLQRRLTVAVYTM